MSKQLPARDLVAKACEKVLASDDMTWPSTSGDKSAEWLGGVVESYGEIWGAKSILEWEQQHGEFAALNLWLLQLAAVVYADFITMANFRDEHSQSVFWDNARGDSPEKNKILFQTVVAQLCNYNHGMFDLAKAGLDLQLLALFRAHVELSEQAVLLSSDLKFFNDYVTSLELADDTQSKQRYQHWKKHLTPSIVRKKLEKTRQHLGIDKAVAADAAKYHRSTYSWMSEHHHGYPLALFVRTYGEGGPKIGGRADKDTVEVLRKITYFNFEFLVLLEGALGRFQGWTMDPGKEFCVEVLFKWRCFRTIASDLMDAEERQEPHTPETGS